MTKAEQEINPNLLSEELELAARTGNLDKLRSGFNRCNINARDNGLGFTALMIAAMCNKVAALELLVVWELV